MYIIIYMHIMFLFRKTKNRLLKKGKKVNGNKDSLAHPNIYLT